MRAVVHKRTTAFGQALAVLLGASGLFSTAGAAPRDDISAAAIELDAAGIGELERAIGGARIVMLGEPWHGDGAAIAERARLVEVLHRRMDFDVLVMEADFYALHRGWEEAVREGRLGEFAARNVYGFWGTSAASAPIWKYVEEQLQGDDPLSVAGIDTKLVGELSRSRFPGELQARLASLGVDAAEAAHAADTLRSLLVPRGTTAAAVTEDDIGSLVRLVDRLADSAEGDTSFWGQMARSLKRNIQGEDRDIGMADNLIWLATHLYPGKKLIVWAHNNHILLDKWALFEGEGPEIARMRASWTQETLGRKTYLGEATRHYFGRSAVYSIATATYAGRYSSDILPALTGRPADFDQVASLEPAAPDTLEAALHGAGHSIAFVDLRPFRGETGTVSTRVIDYSQTPALPMRLWGGYDGLLYLDHTYGLNESP